MLGKKSADELYEKFDELIKLEKFKEAIACCDEAIEIVAATIQGKNEDMKKAFLNNEKTKIRYDLACGLSEDKRYEEALEWFDSTLEILSKYPILRRIGVGAEGNAPERYEVLVKKGDALRRLGRYDEAITCCSLALEANPKFHEAYLEKGHALYELGRFEEAVDAYERGLKVPGQFTFRVVCDLFFAKGVTLDRLGKYDEAITSYDSALRIAPKDEQIYALKVNALHKLGRYDDIIVTFGELFKRKPGFTGKIDHMDIYYDKLLESNPNDINILYKKGQFLYESKKYQEAVVTFDRVLAINPNHYGAQTDKKNALTKLGR